MSIQNINDIIDEPISDDALALKDKIRVKKDDRGMTNQDISDSSGLSIHTVNNYFSNKSKAPSVYTVGPICAALNVSLDQYFGIVPGDASSQVNKHESKIAELEQRCKELEKENKHKDELLSVVSEELRKKHPLIKFLIGIISAMVGIAFLYLLAFDLTNPEYGLFQGQLSEFFSNLF